MSSLDFITEIIYQHIGGATDDYVKSKGIYDFAQEIAKDIVVKVPQLDHKTDDRTNTDPRFHRYRTFGEQNIPKWRQALETWLACKQQGKSPIEEIVWQKKKTS